MKLTTSPCAHIPANTTENVKNATFIDQANNSTEKNTFDLLPNYVRLERARKMKRKVFLRWELKNKAAAKKRERQLLDLSPSTTPKPISTKIILTSSQMLQYASVFQNVAIFFMMAILCYLFYHLKIKSKNTQMAPDIPQNDLISI